MLFREHERAPRGAARPGCGRRLPTFAVALLVGALAVLSGVAAGQSAALADMRTTPLLDDFDRPNENPLSGGGKWAQTDSGLWTPLQLSSNHVTHQAGSGSSQSHWTQQTFDGDVEAWARASGGGASGIGWGVALFRDVGGANAVDGYRFRIEVSTGGGSYTLRRFTNGAQTLLASAGGAPTGGPGWLLIRRSGPNVEGWRSPDGTSWTLAVSAVDTTYTTGLHLSLGITDNSGSQILGFDDFGGGAGGRPPAPSGPPPGQSIGTCSGSGSLGVSGSMCLSDPVNTRTGAFTTSVEDLATPATGVPFSWVRSYTSSDSRTGPLGPGWTHTYAASLELQADGDVLARGEEGQQLHFARRSDGSFVGDAGARATLSALAGGYELVRADQVTYGFDEEGRVLSIEDRNGQGVTLAYDGQGRLSAVRDAAGRQTTVSYNASDLVSSVSTEDGRGVSYGYSAGRLTSVTDVRGKTWAYTYDALGRLANAVDPLGRSHVENVYGADGRVQRQRDALGNSTTFHWDSETEIATVTDANGNAWMHDYDEGALTRQIDPLGHVTQVGRDTDLNETAVTSPTGETTRMTYDLAGNVLSATAPASLGSAQKTFAYNGRNDPTQVTDAVGTVTSYAYDSSGNTTAVTQAGTEVAAFAYDGAGRMLTSTDGNGATTTYAYNAAGNLASSTDALGNRTTYTYDDAGRVLTRVDPKGNVPGCSCAAQFTWSYTSDAAGRQLTETDPLGHTRTNAYDDLGRLTSATDENGHTTSYTYDEASRVLAETGPDPDGGGPLAAPVTRYAYDRVGNKVAETGPRGYTKTFAYDSANRLVSETAPDPDGAGPLAPPVTRHTYDANGSLASSVEPRGSLAGADPDDFRTRYAYDAAGRILTATDPLGNTTVNVYDQVGNLASVRDAKSRTKTYSYDGGGRILGVAAPDLGVTTYAYDDAGNLLTRRDAKGHTTSYDYDAGGRLTSETGPDPDGPGSQSAPVTSYTYDANGNRLSVTDANGNATPTVGDGRTTYGYDRANRLTSIAYSDATPDVTFTHDAAGNRMTMTDGSGTERRTYDGLDRLLSVARGASTFSYAYDAASNVTRRTYPGGATADYTFDPVDRLASVHSGGQTTSYAYDAASNLVETELPVGSGQVETRAYDRAGRLTEVSSARGSTILARFVATLDAVGNPTQLVRTGALAQTQTYTYDGGDRLTGVCFQAGGCPGAADPFIRWTYDEVGNRSSEQRPGSSTSYRYDAGDRLLTAGSASFTYDQNGNQLSAGGRSFAYDLANRLRSTAQGGATTIYTYDGDGVRLQASTGSRASKKTNFLWDVNGVLPQIARESDGNDNELRRYVYGVRRISQTAGNSTSYFVHDPLGSVANLTSSSGTTQRTWSYEPFGSSRTETKGKGSQPESPMRFAGEYLDPTGLYHLRARQYDPAIGRFLRPDPVDAGVGSPLVGSYVYAADRPTVMIDPSGEILRPSDGGLGATRLPASLVDFESPDHRCQAPACGKRPPRPPITCGARPGHPLSRVGIDAGGRAGHRAKALTGWKNDNAQDITVPVGTSICAVFEGRVESANSEGSDGLTLTIAGRSDRVFYHHLSKRFVTRGQRVREDRVLGKSGKSSNGAPHLHIALERGNPERFCPGPYLGPCF